MPAGTKNPWTVGHLTEDRSNIGGTRRYLGWSHIRLSVVVPIGVIVAVAIVCVVVAVLSSARRADEVALDTERQLFTRALADHGERVLREIESVSTSEIANRRIRLEFHETQHERAQEFSISAITDGQKRQVVRQQWSFSPTGSTTEVEDYTVNLASVSALELVIDPGRHDQQAHASLQSIAIA